MTESYSVLMSVYYKEKPEYLKLAIQSMLDQTIKADEFIVVKDGPLTAELDAVLDGYVESNPGLFTFIATPTNLGLGPALRKGVIAARNELIARMDSDDYVVPERCEKQLKLFEMNPNLGMVGSYEAEFIGSIDNVVSIHSEPETNQEIYNFMRRRCAVLHPTVIFKKSEVIRAGNYQETSFYAVYEDYDLFARMIFDAKVKCYNIQECLYYIRTSEDFYERRGGKKYAKTVLRFKWHLFKKGHMSFIDFCVSGLGQAFVCVLPNKVRKLIYMKLLRK
ncbi:glycosyltransferase [Faecalicatena contorta]|uniref:glycosyltransferase n=1 Tax=Faecalicatena contorta TaxID=39482 RepID=UPI00129D47AA|nr:glycosyltransferase [Faecalicatena contorta]MRM91189.1 glycosyltransferase [Faecalicatena contorta]